MSRKRSGDTIDLFDAFADGEIGHVVATTYTFDPGFFEELVLPRWRRAGVRGATLLVDGGQLSQALDERGPPLRMGRDYALQAVHLRYGAFHPKLVIGVGPTRGVLVCASANITSAGWKGSTQLELAHHEIVEAESPSAVDCAVLLDRLAALASAGSPAARHLKTMRSAEWLPARASEVGAPRTLLTGTSGSLATHLATRWKGRRFNTLRAVTGSTDEAGAMLRWAVKEFGVRRCDLLIGVDGCALSKRGLAGLPADLVVRQRPCAIHQKLFLFEGPRGAAMVFGSANFSAAAWTRTIAEGGNVEAVVVLDSVDAKAVETRFLSPDDEAGDWSPPAEAPASDEPHEESKPGLSVTSATLDRARLMVSGIGRHAGPIAAEIRPSGAARVIRDLVPGDSTTGEGGSIAEADGSELSLPAILRVVRRGEDDGTASNWVPIVDLRSVEATWRAPDPLAPPMETPSDDPASFLGILKDCERWLDRLDRLDGVGLLRAGSGGERDRSVDGLGAIRRLGRGRVLASAGGGGLSLGSFLFGRRDARRTEEPGEFEPEDEAPEGASKGKSPPPPSEPAPPPDDAVERALKVLLRFVGKAGERLGEQDSTTILGAEKVLRLLAAIDFVLVEGDRLESKRSGRSEVVVPDRTVGRVLRGLCDLLDARSPGPALRRPTALALFLSVAQRLWSGPMRSAVLWRLQDCAWLATLPETDAHEELWNSATEYLQPAAASRLGEALRLYELVATTKSALRDLAPAAGFDLALLRYRPTGWLLHRTFGLCEYELIEDDGDGSSETALYFVWSDAGDDEPDELDDGRRVREPVQLRMVGKHYLHLDAIARGDRLVGASLIRLGFA